MPDRTFGLWLEKLSSFVAPGGLLVFTTHGETTHRDVIPSIVVNEDGHGFIATSEQFDLDTQSYGHAISYERYVRRKLAALADMLVVEFLPGVWWSHQDCFVLKKASRPS